MFNNIHQNRQKFLNTVNCKTAISSLDFKYMAPINPNFKKLHESTLSLLDSLTISEESKIRKDLPDFLNLIGNLLELRNNPLQRNGQKKAVFIKSWLNDRGVEANILKLPNPDSSKTANEDNSWYVVQADQHFSSKSRGLIIAHHDTISAVAKKATFSELIIGDSYGLSHPWLLDDTIQLAATMYSAINTLNNKELNLTYLFTDGEEVNTLGMRSWLENTTKKLHFDYVIVCEASGRTLDFPLTKFSNGTSLYQGQIPSVCYANRGKATGLITSTEKHTAVEYFQSFVCNFRSVQSYIYAKSQEIQKDLELPKPTAVTFSVAEFTNTFANVFFEARTNSKIGAYETIKMLRNYKNLSNALAHIEKLSVNLETFTFKEISKSLFELSLVNGKSIHTGSYNPYFHENAQTALELVIYHLTTEERSGVTKIKLGSEDKPNSVPQEASIFFEFKIDFTALLKRMSESKRDWRNILAEFYASTLQSNIYWNVLEDPFVPIRDVVSVDKEVWHIVERAQETLGRELSLLFNTQITPSIGVFNAMTDIGPATYAQNEWFWPKSPTGAFMHPVITLGVGDFSLLHTEQEALTPAEILIAMVMYKSLPAALT